MNLIIDIGNTRSKFYLFENQQLIKKENIAINFRKSLEFFIKDQHIDNVMLSNVGNKKYNAFIQNIFKDKVLELSRNLKFPFENKYQSPETLGVDRLALVSAAVKYYPNKAVLVIDMGSCITYDYLNSEGFYMGGAISEGKNMRFKSMHEFTENLPLLKSLNEEIKPLGVNTESCMKSGVIHGITYELEGYINYFKEKNANLTVILTGGDAEYFVNTIKNPIFAEPNFLAEGLNYILEANI